MRDLLFVYGTLLNEDNEYAVYLKANSKFYISGKLRGKLYNVGEYPGAILEGENSNYIYGAILEIVNPEKVWPVIDDYEGYGENQSQPNEFIRIPVEVETGGGPVICWAYLYNWPLTGLIQIEDGRYKK
ncbi:MAG: gamma-glutamylcyclotransferase family protein [Mucilaginibacter sp.]